MREPRFCSSCGEKISRPQTVWKSPSYCPKCAPGFLSKRLSFVAALTLIVVASFFVGRYTSPPKRLYFIGTPADETVQVSVQSGPDPAPGPNETVARSTNDSAIPTLATEAMCGARTRSGKLCQRKVKGGGFCWQHRQQPETSRVSKR
jgi:hypothetical protein